MAAGVVVVDGGPGFGTVDRRRCQVQSRSVQSGTLPPIAPDCHPRTEASRFLHLFLSRQSALRSAFAGEMGDQDGFAAALDVFDE